MHKVFFKMGMRADYIEIMGAMATCLKIRNLFAHCHWGQSKKRGLFFIDLEAAGRAPGRLKLNNFRHADAKTLAQIEDYLCYTFLCLDYVAKEFSIRADLMRGPAPCRPTRLRPLKHFHSAFPTPITSLIQFWVIALRTGALSCVLPSPGAGAVS